MDLNAVTQWVVNMLAASEKQVNEATHITVVYWVVAFENLVCYNEFFQQLCEPPIYMYTHMDVHSVRLRLNQDTYFMAALEESIFQPWHRRCVG